MFWTSPASIPDTWYVLYVMYDVGANALPLARLKYTCSHTEGVAFLRRVPEVARGRFNLCNPLACSNTAPIAASFLVRYCPYPWATKPVHVLYRICQWMLIIEHHLSFLGEKAAMVRYKEQVKKIHDAIIPFPPFHHRTLYPDRDQFPSAIKPRHAPQIPFSSSSSSLKDRKGRDGTQGRAKKGTDRKSFFAVD